MIFLIILLVLPVPDKGKFNPTGGETTVPQGTENQEKPNREEKNIGLPNTGAVNDSNGFISAILALLGLVFLKKRK